MKSSIPGLQRAVLARLNADSALSALVSGRVYDTAPADAIYPLVSINSISATSSDTDTTDGEVIELALSVFTRGVGARVEANRIGAAVIGALDRKASMLAVPGFNVFMCAAINSLVFRDDAEQGGAHGVFRFQILVESLATATGY